MASPVFLTERAERDVEAISTWWSEHRSTSQARRWLSEFDISLDRLGSNPERFAAAAENAKLPLEIKQMNFGLAGKKTHRAVFTIHPDKILVLRVLHLAQQELSPDDI